MRARGRDQLQPNSRPSWHYTLRYRPESPGTPTPLHYRTVGRLERLNRPKRRIVKLRPKRHYFFSTARSIANVAQQSIPGEKIRPLLQGV